MSMEQQHRGESQIVWGLEPQRTDSQETSPQTWEGQDFRMPFSSTDDLLCAHP